MSHPGFYKFTNDLLHYAGTSVYAPEFTLTAANHADYIYPVDDWHWFDSRQLAEAFWGINDQSDARWVEFGAALASDQLANQWFSDLFSQAPILHSMMGVGLGQAAQGDTRTFLAAWAGALSADLITPEFVAHLVEMATEYALPSSFIAGLQQIPSGPISQERN